MESCANRRGAGDPPNDIRHVNRANAQEGARNAAGLRSTMGDTRTAASTISRNAARTTMATRLMQLKL